MSIFTLSVNLLPLFDIFCISCTLKDMSTSQDPCCHSIAAPSGGVVPVQSGLLPDLVPLILHCWKEAIISHGTITAIVEDKIMMMTIITKSPYTKMWSFLSLVDVTETVHGECAFELCKNWIMKYVSSKGYSIVIKCTLSLPIMQCQQKRHW